VLVFSYDVPPIESEGFEVFTNVLLKSTWVIGDYHRRAACATGVGATLEEGYNYYIGRKGAIHLPDFLFLALE
jgi:hypothetical protein